MPMQCTDIIDIVAEAFEVQPTDILHGRQRHPSAARFAAIHLCRQHLGMTYKQLGQQFSRRPSSIHHNLQTHKVQYDRLPWVRVCTTTAADVVAARGAIEEPQP